MTWNNFREPVARKKHTCIHCFTPIIIGEKHKQWVGEWEGEFQDWRVHLDCYEPLTKCQDEFGAICEDKHERGKTCAFTQYKKSVALAPTPEERRP